MSVVCKSVCASVSFCLDVWMSECEYKAHEYITITHVYISTAMLRMFSMYNEHCTLKVLLLVCMCVYVSSCLCLFVSRAMFSKKVFLTETHEDISNSHVEDVHVGGGLHGGLGHDHHQHQQVA